MRDRTKGFSLVEVVLALGVIAFAIVGVIALLPLGFELAQNSREDIQAANLISVVSSDLRDTLPGNPESTILHLSPLPWVPDATSQAPRINPQVLQNTNHTFFAADGQRMTMARQPDSRYRVSLRYLPPAPGRSMVQAVVTVSWPPAVDPLSAAADAPEPQGKVEALLTFPMPSR